MTAKARAKSAHRYQPVLKLPALPYEQFLALKDNIALNGVLVPILVDEQRKIIDGNYRKAIAEELGYDCPEIVQTDLTDDEKRSLARALNLARRQLTQEQKRQLVGDQIEETPEKSNRWLGKILGVHHATVASCPGRDGINWTNYPVHRTVGEDGKERPRQRCRKSSRGRVERQTRLQPTTLIHGDCRNELRKLATASIDAIITDPIYPEVNREYGKITEDEWHDLMQDSCR